MSRTHKKLTVYVTSHCKACEVAFVLADRLQTQRPTWHLEIIETNNANDVPISVIGTPIYLWQNKTVFLGNPSEQELIQFVDQHDQ